MAMNSLTPFALVTLTSLASVTALGADRAAGQKIVEQNCAECHRTKDWNGETQDALESLIRDIVAGKIKHPQRKLDLTQEDIVNIAAFWTSGRK